MSKWISRKLVMAVLTPIIAIVAKKFGLDDTAIAAIVGTIAAYILGQSHVDAKEAASKVS